MSCIRYVASCIAVLALCGCDQKSKPAPQKGAGSDVSQGRLVVGKDDRPIEKLMADEVIVAVNGVPLKRKDYDLLLQSIDYMHRLLNPKQSMLDLETHRQQRARSLVREFMTKEVLVQEARRRGLKADPEIRASLRSVLEKVAQKEGLTLEALPKSENPLVRIVCEGVEDQALIASLRQAEFGDKLKVTDADVQAYRERLKRYNEMCEATNQLVKARAAKICERLRKGEDFTQVAAATSEYKDDANNVWGTFARGEIEDARVRNAAFTLPVGAASEPFETQDGMVIIKVLEREGSLGPVAAGEPTVKLGRILLLLGEEAKIPDDRVLRSRLEQERLKKLQSPWLAELQQKALVEFPHGTNLWKKVKR